jgi:hypothetical protein
LIQPLVANAEHIQELSPTLVVAIRRCGLAVYLNRSSSKVGGASTSNPPARLGAAIHRVLAWVAEGGLDAVDQTSIESAIRKRWTDELTLEERMASSSAVESYFGPAKTWPGFATAEERLVIEASWLAAEVVGSSRSRRWAEREFSASSPSMRGTPDLVMADSYHATVIEFKSGKVTPEDVKPTGRYWLQAHLYAWMVLESGLDVDVCEIRPVGRPRLAVEVNDHSIRTAREMAAEALSDFNAAVDSGDVRSIANPSDQSCIYCTHVLRCPALWGGEGMPKLDELQVVEGTVSKLQETQFGSMAMELDEAVGTRTGTVTINGLDPRRIAALRGLKLGDQIRISGLHAGRSGNTLTVRSGSWVKLERTVAIH